MGKAIAVWLVASLQGTVTASPRDACDAELAGEFPVVLEDGRAIYVERNVFVSGGAGILLAGTPNFISGPGGTLTRDSIMGVVLSVGQPATPVPWPREGQFTGLRALALPDGTWAVVMAEVEGAQPPRGTAVAYWAGITDGRDWRAIQKLPAVSGELNWPEASKLIYLDGELALAVPVRYADYIEGVAVFTQRAGEWHVNLVPTRVAAYVTLAPSAEGELLLGVVRPDSSMRPDRNSLFVYRRVRPGEPWVEMRRLVLGGRIGVHHPEFLQTAHGVSASWLFGGWFRPARVSLGLPALAEENVFTLAHQATDVVPLAAPDVAPIWVTAEPEDDDTYGLIRVYQSAHQAPSLLLSLPTPFHSMFLAAVLVSEHIVITGPILSFTQDVPTGVTSHMVVVRLRCDAPGR